MYTLCGVFFNNNNNNNSTDRYRSAKSFVFAGKSKTLIRGGAYELLINYFIFELHSMQAIQFCCQECTTSCCRDFNTLRGSNSSSASFLRRNLEVGVEMRKKWKCCRVALNRHPRISTPMDN